jgi:hypothetical protein
VDVCSGGALAGNDESAWQGQGPMLMGGDVPWEPRSLADPGGAGGAALFLGGWRGEVGSAVGSAGRSRVLTREESMEEGNEKGSGGGLSRRRKFHRVGRTEGKRRGRKRRSAEGRRRGRGSEGKGEDAEQGPR